MRTRPAWIIAALFAASCAESIPSEPRVVDADLSASKQATAPSASADTNTNTKNPSADKLVPGATEPPAPMSVDAPLPPLARDARGPCDVARAGREKAKASLASGHAYRALRELDAADRLCAADADAAARKSVRDALSAPASAAGASLVAAAEAAKARGAAPTEIQKLADQALARLELEASAKPSLLWTRDISSVTALSADGTKAVFMRGSTAILADAARLAPTRFFDHERPVKATTIARDGRLIATLDEAGAAYVWSADTGKRVQRFAWAGERATAAAFTSDGKRLAVVSSQPFDTAIRLWNVETGDSIASFGSQGTGEPSAVALSRDDKILAVGTERGHLELWSIGPKPKVAFILANRESFLEAVVSIAFSAKGDRVAAVFENGAASVWDTATGKQAWIATTPGAFQEPGAVFFSADGKRLLAGWSESRAGATLRAWDAATGAEQKNEPVPGRAVAFSEDGKRALIDGERSISLFDLAESKELVTRSTQMPSVTHVLFGPPRVLAVDLDRDESLHVLVPGGLRTLPIGDTSRKLAPSLDGKSLAVLIHSEVTLWDLATSRPRERMPRLPFYPRSVAFAPDGSVRATDAFTEIVLVNSTPNRSGWNKVFSKTRDKGFPSLELAMFGRRAVAVVGDEVGIIDADTGQARALDHGMPESGSATLTPDSRAVFLLHGGQLHRFDALTGAALGPPAALDCSSRDLSISFDGSRIATGCGDAARVLSFSATPPSSVDIPSGRGTRDVAIAPHGDLVATSHDDGQIQLWRADDGRLVGRVRFFVGRDAALVESADGRIELLGSNAADLEQELVCRVGATAYPFELCRDAVVEPGLLAELLAPR